MDLRYSEADEGFRADLRGWLDATLPQLAPAPPREAWPERRKWDTEWQRRLFDAGYAGLHWPKEFGGRGASPTEQLIFFEETARAKAPYVGVNFVGTLHAGPTLIEEGSDAQKAAHLPRILCGDEVWCQGFSEPGARVRSREPAHARGSRRRRLRAQRAEDLVLVRSRRRRRRVPRAHRSGSAEAQGHLVAHPADGPAGHRGAPAQDRARLVGVRRGVPHRRARAGGEPSGRGERRLAHHERDAEVRARHRVRQRADRFAPAVRRTGAARARRRATARARSLSGRVRRAVVADEAQRVAGRARCHRTRRDGDEARVFRSAAALRRALPAGARSRRAARRRQRTGRGAPAHAGAADRRGRVADPAQHHLRTPVGHAREPR